MIAFTQHEVQRAGRSIRSISRPSTIGDALSGLAENPSARLLAGGTDLLLHLARSGPGADVDIVDLTSIAGFREIGDEGSFWRLSAGVTHNQIVAHESLRSTALPLAQACLEIGSPQLRNRATIAGNIATASPANDTISALMALDAKVEVSQLVGGSIEAQLVPIRNFFPGFRQTVLQPDQLITSLHVPKLVPSERGIWVKLGLRKAQAISVVHAGIVIGVAEDGVVERASLAMGSVAPTVVMVDAFEEALVGRKLDDDSIAHAAEAAADAITPISDGRGTAEYRRSAVVPLLARSLQALATNVQASAWPHNPPTLGAGAQRQDPVQRTVEANAPVGLTINGDPAELDPTQTLLDAVRATGRTGQKEGCAEGECGACTMWFDGDAVMSCLVLAAQVDGGDVITIEGLDHPIQQTFVDDFAVQCGFCIPGFLMAGAKLVDTHPDPTHEQIQLGLAGNLCRCTGYYPIVEAVRDAAVVVRGRS